MRYQDRIARVDDDQIAPAEQHHQPRVRMDQHPLRLKRDRVAANHVAASVADRVPQTFPGTPATPRESPAPPDPVRALLHYHAIERVVPQAPVCAPEPG